MGWIKGLALFLILAATGTVALLATRSVQSPAADRVLPTGKEISPLGEHVEVGSYPVNMVLSKDGRFVVVTSSGYRQQLTVIDAATGAITDKVDFGGVGSKTGLYYGLSVGASGKVYASQGALDKIATFDLSETGKLVASRVFDNPPPAGLKGPNHVSGVSESGGNLVVVNNQTTKETKLKGSISVLDIATGERKSSFEVGGFPYGVATVNGQAYVSSERDGIVSTIDLASGKSDSIRVGQNSTTVMVTPDQRTVLVSNSNSDTVSVIGVASKRVTKTILLRPADLRSVPGCTPLGIAVEKDNKRAFVAMADLNAVAVVDLEKGQLEGYLPVGWYPTSVIVAGNNLFVSNAKGVKTKNPNGKAVGTRGKYILNIIEGTVCRIKLDEALRELPRHTRTVLELNRTTKRDVDELADDFKNPGIEHVIYVIKENRTFDQMLGDLPRANGDPTLCLFPREVTPNQHALAERFVTLDNFHVCAEVSADGWNWSTSGMANEYTSRNSVYSYSDRGRDYDFEGTNNGIVPEREGYRDVAEAEGGYIWTQAYKQKISFRNYGMFLTFDSGSDDKRETIYEPDNAPAKKELYGSTEPNFKRYDTSYPDSEAYIKHGLSPAPRQAGPFGKLGDRTRMTVWLRDYDRLAAEKKMPKLMLLRLGRDHTAGTAAGQYAPRAMVADNDFAIGQLVEKVSHGPYWDKTAIFVVEDDAQAGFDHVDAHRSLAMVVSPFTKRSSLDSRFYNTDSVLRTMSLLIGLKPWNQYIVTAIPLSVFDNQRSNAEPYNAILPARDIIGDINKRNAYRAVDSERMLDRYEEESVPDMELNDILWGAIKGPKAPRPSTPGAKWKTDRRPRSTDSDG